MVEQDRTSGGAGGDGLAAGEAEQLVYGLETRFAAPLEAAAAAVREAERELVEAQEQLAQAQEAATDERYTSDPLVFMRASVTEEVEALERKTNPKKLRTSYRFLLDRAVELAAGEVQGLRDDLTTARRERESGLEASVAAEQRAIEALEAAQVMHERVLTAQRSARQGLSLLIDKLTEG